jgi:hypothetical protein
MSRGSTPSVPSAVGTIITHNQAVYECLKQKIINYHALAMTIKPEVDKLVGKSVSINTIVVAIKRFSDGLLRVKPQPPLNILRDARITLTSDVADVTLKPKKSEFQTILKRIVEISSQLNEPPDMFQLSHLIKLVADEQEYKSLIRSELDNRHITKESVGLSKLTLHLSPDVNGTSGFALFITELLYRHGISILHSYIDEDTVIILNKKDGPRAYEILEGEIVRSKGNKETKKN